MNDLPSFRDPATAMVALRNDLVFTPDLSSEPARYTIEDPLRGKFYRVGLAEFAFLSLLDGRTSIAEAIGLAAARLGDQALAAHDAMTVCRWLLDCQLAQPCGHCQAERIEASARRNDGHRLLLRLNPLAIQVPLFEPDRLLTALSRRLDWLFAPWFAAVWGAAVLYATYLAASGWMHLSESTGVILDRDNWLKLAAAWLLLKVLHELGHGLACKRFGGEVPAAGITFLLFFPLAFVDVTSSWRFRSRGQRIVTAAAGMYFELFVAAIAVIVWSRTAAGLAHCLALNIAVTAGLSTILFNANPLVRFDGYFILSDLLDLPNLYSRSQRWLADWVRRHVLGCGTTCESGDPRGWLLGLYGIASLAWRFVFYAGLALLLIARLSYLGGVLAVGLLGMAWGLPALHAVREVFITVTLQGVSRRRVAVSAVAMLLLLLAGVVCLVRPGRVEAPAVVEYAPLTIIRAETPGFVRDVRVASGQQVERGQVVAVLENSELRAELADLELTLQQSIIRGREDMQENELPKLQVEVAQQHALEKKIDEARRRAAALTVRAPSAGRIVARDLDTLLGRYFEEGHEIAMLGQEDAKEVVIAIPQDDAKLFEVRRSATAEVDVRSKSGCVFPALLTRIEPRGSIELPHGALAANVGGPLPVKLRSHDDKSPTTHAGSCDLLAPVFVGRAALPPAPGAQLRAGQLATVSFRSTSETAATRWLKSAIRWTDRYTSAQ